MENSTQKKQKTNNEGEPNNLTVDSFELSYSLFNKDFYPGIIIYIGDIVLGKLLSNEDKLEIEFKLGSILDEKKQRIVLETNTESVIKKSNKSFSSSIPKENFEQLRKKLNNLLDQNLEQGYLSEIIQRRSRDTLDRTYETPDGDVRVSYNLQDMTKIKKAPVIKKQKFNNIDIYCPKSEFDIRLSINKEHKITNFEREKHKFVCQRKKYRTTYKYKMLLIELTRTITSNAPTDDDTGNEQFEVEVELLHLALFRKEAEKYKAGDETNRYHELINFIYCNVRSLTELN